MLVLFIKLLLAHIIGDFLFQPTKWVKHKKKKKHKSKFLYWHVLIHLGALLLVLQFNYKYWLGILIIIVSHYSIDLLKLNLQNKSNQRILFFSDQLLHIVILLAVVSIYEAFNLDFSVFYSFKPLLLITFVIIVTYVLAVMVKVLLTKWKMKDTSPNQAGKYIGMLERLFIFFFIILDYWEGIGFLLAAKSVFRFGDLSTAKDRNLTEYILIGTLISFGGAIAMALFYQYLLEYSITLGL